MATKKEEQVQDFSIPNGMSAAEYIQKEIEKAEKKMLENSKKKLVNTVMIGCKLVDKDFKEGAEIRKDGQVLTDEFTGEVKRYPSKYYATFNFMGGQIKTEIKESEYSSLEINEEYLCHGYMGEVKEFGKTSIQPIFNKYELLA